MAPTFAMHLTWLNEVSHKYILRNLYLLELCHIKLIVSRLLRSSKYRSNHNMALPKILGKIISQDSETC